MKLFIETVAEQLISLFQYNHLEESHFDPK